MKMSDGTFILVLIFLLICTSGIAVHEKYLKASLISPCEAEQPRNQHCELIAVPVITDKENSDGSS